MCENEQKPELDPEPWKKRAPESELQSCKPTTPELEPEPLSLTEELRSRTCVIFATAPQPCSCQSIFLK